MSDQPTRAEVALNALADVRAVLDEWTGSDWVHSDPAREIDHILHLAYAKLRMQSMRRERRPATWLAQPISTVWPQEIAWRRGEESVTALCFAVRITDGAKGAVGRKVEVRMSASDAAFLAMAMAGMAEWGKGKPGPTNILDELLPGGSIKEEGEAE
jgi:hypothetical protein